jgi:hypothetical protein
MRSDNKGFGAILKAHLGSRPSPVSALSRSPAWRRPVSLATLIVAIAECHARVLGDETPDRRLADPHDRFTEGFDTTDLKAAKALLDSLQ